MFIISAIQTILFVLVGNYILEIKGMWFEYWLILFSTSCFANLLGLNISSTFDSAKVIYILIPIMIIPQLLFSGVIVKFDRLHPLISKVNSVPWIGNVMASRWAYEALAVSQYKRNKYEKPFYVINQKNSEASWKRDYWLPELKNQMNIINNYSTDTSKTKLVHKAHQILIHEITKEEHLYDPTLKFTCPGCIESLLNENWSKEIKVNMTTYFKILKRIYNDEVNTSIDENNKKIASIGAKKLRVIKSNYYNESLSDFATNRTDLDKIIIKNNELIQKADPIYKIPRGKAFFNTHFYAPGKNLFGNYMSTFLANIILLWSMTIILIITLYFDFFRKLMLQMGRLFSKN
jgi:hypothetical protein